MSENRSPSLRRLQKSDAAVLRELAILAYREAYRESLTSEEIELRIVGRHGLERFEQQLEDPAHEIWGVSDGQGTGKLLGFAHLNFGSRSETCATDGYPELYRIYVHPSWIGKGLGQRLLGRMEEICLERKLPGLWLHCFDQNLIGILFYQKMGFQIIGRDPFEIIPGLRRYDFVFMKKFPSGARASATP